ncbi:hypothetical protein Belba_1320 [Belliella baltica DSM 15883]|uniref:Secretion system C-terminal sorting domain-containing protein n=1 Tax=Belliella baltica (strain DSM 15883 / CIP 108006 / LMG 21964 / BA134) TaxID=866536 RepID=I3Z3X7_BELBD|nr:T9SS type A sorting domain-containing protein [Belliella baltica]AFL83945.1 hypothetical protein Belba_1320 [Belliella baltica DSM 15883]
MTFWIYFYQSKAIRNSTRIYRIILFFLVYLFFAATSFSQIILENGDYRTIATGDFDNPAIWEVWNGTAWVAAIEKPTATNNIFLQRGHEVRLMGNEEANNVYLYSAASPGRKLNLQTFELRVNGALRGLRLESGEFEINTVTNATTDWIYPETGSIVFVGESRVVVDRASWSASNNNSRYRVIFRPNAGQTLTVNSAFKANAFIIESGTVRQTLNTSGIPACSTFSYNIQAAFNGTGPYGDFIIESGATLISECPGPPQEQIIRRTATIPGALFHLKPGGNLVLLENNPQMDVADFRFEGNVYYRSNTGTQSLIQTTFANSGNPKHYHNLLFENAALKVLPDSIFLTGDIGRLTGPEPSDGPTFLSFQGTGEQQIVNWDIDVSQIEVDKPTGRIFSNNDIRSKGNFFMTSGQIDFNGYDLYVNTIGSGAYFYSGGTWRNIQNFFYQNLPTSLDGKNSSFPFEDVYQDGIRRMRLTGNSPGGNLNIRYIEIPGSNDEPDYNDTDGTPILYQLNSYFELSGLSAGTDPIRMELAAENLIVDAVDDLRIVSNGLAAPGIHVPGADADTLWARRDLLFDELNNQSFTIGSYRYLSILPVTYLEQKAVWNQGKVRITWTTAEEKDNQYFEVEKAIESMDNFQVITKIPSHSKAENTYTYEFDWKEPIKNTYFRIKQTDFNGTSTYSKVFRLEGGWKELDVPRIYPNPLVSEPLHLILPSHYKQDETIIQIVGINGITHFSDSFRFFKESFDSSILDPGIYIFIIHDRTYRHHIKFIKK